MLYKVNVMSYTDSDSESHTDEKSDYEVSTKELCELLLNTYNTNYLDFYAHKDIMTEISVLMKGKKAGNQILMSLIRNHTRPYAKPVVPYISGPKFLTLLTSEKYNSTVYLFGESHGITNLCDDLEKEPNIAITDYLVRLVGSTDVFLDIFLELGPSTLKTYQTIFGLRPGFGEHNWALYKLHDTFRDCMVMKNCPLIRVHWSDLRIVGGLDILDTDYGRIPSNSFLRLVQWVCPRTTWPPNEFIQDALEQFSGIINTLLGPEARDFLIKEIEDYARVLKELQKSFLKAEILEFCMNNFKLSLKKDLGGLQYYLKLVKNGTARWTDIAQVCDYLIVLGSEYMDMYLLSRMFKEFDSPGHAPKTPKNIIFYGGKAHARKYSVFLRSIGYKTHKTIEETEIDGRSVRCLDMKDFPQPFFTQAPL